MQRKFIKFWQFIGPGCNPLVLCFAFLLSTVSQNAYGQAEIKKTLTLHHTNVKIADVLQRVEEQSGVSFSYAEQVIADLPLLTIHMDHQPLDKVLEVLSEKCSIRFTNVGNTLIIEKAPSPTPKEKAGRKLEGRVIDKQTSEPLPGVNVVAPGTSMGTMTDAAGTFQLYLPEEIRTLVFSFIGYGIQRVEVAGISHLEVALVEEKRLLNDIVVVGYGTQLRENVTGSIVQVKSNDVEDIPVVNMEQAIAGQMPGVQVTQPSGAPGSNPSIQIRGIGTITAGSQPLVVIDGFPTSPGNSNLLNPEDIASVEILKDAAASSIYGSRGSNGVILITTKDGSGGKPALTFHTYHGFQRVSRKVDLTDAYENAELVAAARNNTWVDSDPINHSPFDPNSVRTGGGRIPPFLIPYLEGQQRLTNTDWQDAIFRDAPMHYYALSLSRGNDHMKYYLSANYLDQDGIIINSGFKRYALRANLENKLSQKVTVGFNLAPSFASYDKVSEDSYKKDGIVLSALMALPNFPVFNADGTLSISEHIKQGAYSTTWVENPVALAEWIDDHYETARMLGGIYFTVQPLPGLQLKSYAGTDYVSLRENYFRPSTLGTYRSVAPSQAEAKSYTSRKLNWVSENTASYDRILGDNHHLSALLGYTVQKEDIETNYVLATNFPNDEVRTINAGQVTEGASTVEAWSLLSYLARLSYNYREKYLVSGSIRRDGSSRFGKDSKWGWFPALSLGWNLSKESFFPESRTLTAVKLRASYGRTGNNLIPNYGATALLSTSNYILDGTIVNGLSPSTAPNTNLSWETTDMVNVGIDVGVRDDQLLFTIDYYNSITRDMLLNVPVPSASGYTYSLQNLGEARNRGIELSLKATVNLGPVKWKSAVNFSSNVNEVLALGPGQNRILRDHHITQVGHPIGSYYGYRVNGVFENEEALSSYPHLASSKVGSYRYVDVSGDGVISEDDRTMLGDFFPDYTVGFSSTFYLKNFDLSFLLHASQGFEIYNLSRAFTAATQGWGNATRDVYNNYFRSSGEPGDGVSRPLTKPTDKLHELSSYMVEDGSFVRVRSITLGYTLPAKVLKSFFIKSIRIYASSRNPFTFTRYSGYNPEVSTWSNDPTTPGIDYGAYPVEKTYVAGVRINF